MKNNTKKMVLLLMAVMLIGGCDAAISSSENKGSNINSVNSTTSNNSSANSNSINNQSSNSNASSNQTSLPTPDGTLDNIGNNEYVFENSTYQYDGQEHAAVIDGLLPYGYRVEYENNTQTEIGEHLATAKIYNAKNELVATKTATIKVIPYQGFPNMRIDTADGTDPDHKNDSTGQKPYKSMELTIDNCDSAYTKNKVSGQIRVRGNSTNQESVSKRAFRIKMGSKTNFFGLGKGNKQTKEKSWVLLADFFDLSMFRNASAFMMGDALFNYKDNYYCSDFKHVNLYMNGEYRGIYLLAEQQQAKTNRVPINELDDDDSETTSNNIAYLVEIDGLVTQKNRVNSQTGLGTSEGDPCFTTNVGSNAGSVSGVRISDKPYVIKTNINTDDQALFIRKYLTNCTIAFANVCNGSLKVVDAEGNILDSPYSNAYETLNSFIDLDSFFRMYLLQEHCKNFDVGWGSFYLYVDFSSNSHVKRLTMSAPWDFDLGLGNKTSGSITKTNDDFLSSSSYANGYTTNNPWLYMLSKTDFFQEMFKKYYYSFSASGVMNKIISFINYESKAFAEEFTSTYDAVGYSSDKGASGATSMQTRQYKKHEDAVTYLTKWLIDRKEYLDGKYLQSKSLVLFSDQHIILTWSNYLLASLKNHAT